MLNANREMRWFFDGVRHVGSVEVGVKRNRGL